MDHRDVGGHLDTVTTALDGAVFRRVIGSFMSGVVVITTEHDGVRHGMTVSAVSSLSLDPPMLLVCLNAGSTTQEAVRSAGRFAVNILGEHQGQLAERFARPGSDDKFAGLVVAPGRSGVPVIEGALATVECRVAEVRGHVVTPLDAATSDDAHDAELAIELGAAEMLVGRLSAGRLARLRELADAAAALVDEGRFGDVDGYIAANHAFHRFLVDATGSRALVEAYEQLSVPELMARALPPGMDADPHLVTDHTDLVDALERGDRDRVRAVMTSHDDNAKATQRAGIDRLGGQL